MENIVIIEEVLCWMDGGTVTLKLRKDDLFFDVEFVQKAFINRKKIPLPGSLLLNEAEVEIRSKSEKEILLEVKKAKFGPKIRDGEKELLKKMIFDAIDFVESNDYLKIAQKVGRIK